MRIAARVREITEWLIENVKNEVYYLSSEL
jgi:hypothetical protein